MDNGTWNLDSILEIKSGKTTSLFNTDLAFKKYKLVNNTEELVVIEEYLNSEDPKPTFKISFKCEDDKCVTEFECIKTPSFRAKKYPNLKKSFCSNTDDVFMSAFNGNKEALKLFEANKKYCGSSESEKVATYIADLKRAKKIKNCRVK